MQVYLIDAEGVIETFYCEWDEPKQRLSVSVDEKDPNTARIRYELQEHGTAERSEQKMVIGRYLELAGLDPATKMIDRPDTHFAIYKETSRGIL